MTTKNIIIDIFSYFAKFPKREGIYPLFNVDNSTMPGYESLRDMIASMETHSLTSIQYYIFGANLEAIGNRVNNIPTGSDFLFVDFGEIDCGIDNSNRMTDSSRLAITVAFRLKNFSIDLAEQTLAFSHSLESIVSIRNTMIVDQKCHSWLKFLSDNHSFVPFVSEKLSSIGWTLYFNREAFDTFDASLLRK